MKGYSRSVSRNGRGWRYGAERVVDGTTSASQVGAPVSHRRPCGGIGEACHWKKTREERRWHKLLLLRGTPVTANRLSVGSVTTHCHPKMWCFKTTPTVSNGAVMFGTTHQAWQHDTASDSQLVLLQGPDLWQPDTVKSVFILQKNKNNNIQNQKGIFIKGALLNSTIWLKHKIARYLRRKW